MKRYSSLAAYLKATRTTQTQLADALGVTQGTVQKWVAGARLPRPMMAARLSQHTGVSMDALLKARLQSVA